MRADGAFFKLELDRASRLAIAAISAAGMILTAAGVGDSAVVVCKNCCTVPASEMAILEGCETVTNFAVDPLGRTQSTIVLVSQGNADTSLEIPQEPPVSTPDPGYGASSSSSQPFSNSSSTGSSVTGLQPPSTEEQTLQPLNLPPVATLNEFLMNGTYTSILGVEVREASARLANGAEVEGLAVQSVVPGSPAARAGILPYRATKHYLIDGAFAAASLFFPPAMLLMAAVDQSSIGTSYDLIIGVDGVRVTNVLEFDDQIRNVKPGDIVYLNIVRDGKRLQIPVELPRSFVTTAAAQAK